MTTWRSLTTLVPWAIFRPQSSVPHSHDMTPEAAQIPTSPLMFLHQESRCDPCLCLCLHAVISKNQSTASVTVVVDCFDSNSSRKAPSSLVVMSHLTFSCGLRLLSSFPSFKSKRSSIDHLSLNSWIPGSQNLLVFAQLRTGAQGLAVVISV